MYRPVLFFNVLSSFSWMLRSSILRAGWEDPPRVSTPSTQSVITSGGSVSSVSPLWVLTMTATVRQHGSVSLDSAGGVSHSPPPDSPRYWDSEQRAAASLCLRSASADGEMWARLTRWGLGDIIWNSEALARHLETELGITGPCCGISCEVANERGGRCLAWPAPVLFSPPAWHAARPGDQRHDWRISCPADWRVFTVRRYSAMRTDKLLGLQHS